MPLKTTSFKLGLYNKHIILYYSISIFPERMGNDSLEELLEDTIHVINIHNTKYPTKFQNNKFKVEQFVSGGEPSPAFIKVVCSFVEDNLNDETCGNYKKGDAKSCYDMYLKNSNPMGFLIMLSKLLPALECPHTVLTTGPVKKRLVTKKAKLLLINFMASFVILLTEHWNSTEQSQLCKKNSFFDGIAHISGPEHTKKVVEKYNIEHLETFGYTVNKSTRTLTFTPTKKKMNQLREGVKNMYIQEKEQLVPSSSSGGRTETPSPEPHIKEKEHDFLCASSTKVHAADVTESSQGCGSTAFSSSQEEAAATDGATGGTGQGGSRRRICWNCHAQENLLKCSGCMRALYCGQRCQEADWARHGGYCEARQRKKRLAEVD